MLICWFNLEMTNLMWYSIVVKHQHSLKKSSDRWVLIVSVLDENKNKIKPQREIPEDTSTLILKMNFEPSSARCSLVTQIHQNHIIIQWQKCNILYFIMISLLKSYSHEKKIPIHQTAEGASFQLVSRHPKYSKRMLVVVQSYQFCLSLQL